MTTFMYQLKSHSTKTILGCTFLLPFLQSENPPKGILQESFSFLSEMEDSFFIFLQFGPPPKGTGFLWFWRNQRIPSVPAINNPSRHKMWVSIVLIYLLYLTKDTAKKNDTTMVKPIAVSHGMVFAIETKPSPPHVCDGLVEGSIEGFY